MVEVLEVARAAARIEDAAQELARYGRDPSYTGPDGQTVTVEEALEEFLNAQQNFHRVLSERLAETEFDIP